MLGGRAVEGDRIEYKTGWNPDAINRSVCAFANGSPKATIETDEERTYFLIDIPCHPGFMKETFSVEQIGVKGGVKGGVKEPNVTKDVTKDVTKKLTERQSVITEDSFVTIPEMSLKTGVATRTIKRDIENLQSSGILTRKGVRKDGRKDGYWEVVKNKYVNRGLIALEGGLVYPLQAFFLINGNACAGH